MSNPFGDVEDNAFMAPSPIQAAPLRDSRSLGRAPSGRSALSSSAPNPSLEVFIYTVALGPILEAAELPTQAAVAERLRQGIHEAEHLMPLLGIGPVEFRAGILKVPAAAQAAASHLHALGRTDIASAQALRLLVGALGAQSACCADLTLQLAVVETPAVFPPDKPPGGLFSCCFRPKVKEDEAPRWAQQGCLAVVRGLKSAMASEPHAYEVPVEAQREVTERGAKEPPVLRVKLRCRGSETIPVAVDSQPITIDLFRTPLELPQGHPLSDISEDAASGPDVPMDTQGRPMADTVMSDCSMELGDGGGTSAEQDKILDKIGRRIGRVVIPREALSGGEMRFDVKTSAPDPNLNNKKKQKQKGGDPSATLRTVGNLKLFCLPLSLAQPAPPAELSFITASLLHPSASRAILESMVVAGAESLLSGRPGPATLLRASAEACPPEWAPFLSPFFCGCLRVYGLLAGVGPASIGAVILRVACRPAYWNDSEPFLEGLAGMVAWLQQEQRRADPQTKNEIQTSLDVLRTTAAAATRTFYQRCCQLAGGGPSPDLAALVDSLGALFRLLNSVGERDPYTDILMDSLRLDMRRVADEASHTAGTDDFVHVRRLHSVISYTDGPAMMIDAMIEAAYPRLASIRGHKLRAATIRYQLITQILNSILPPGPRALSLPMSSEMKALEASLIVHHDRLATLGFTPSRAAAAAASTSLATSLSMDGDALSDTDPLAILIDISPHFLPSVKVWLRQLVGTLNSWATNTALREETAGWAAIPGAGPSNRDRCYSTAVVDLFSLLNSSLAEALMRVDPLTAVRTGGIQDDEDLTTSGGIRTEDERRWTLKRLEEVHDMIEPPFTSCIEDFCRLLDKALIRALSQHQGVEGGPAGTILGSIMEVQRRTAELQGVLERWARALMCPVGGEGWGAPGGGRGVLQRDASHSSLSDLSDVSLMSYEEKDIESIALANPMYDGRGLGLAASMEFEENPMSRGTPKAAPRHAKTPRSPNTGLTSRQRAMLDGLGGLLESSAGIALEWLGRSVQRLCTVMAAGVVVRSDMAMEEAARLQQREAARVEMMKEEAKLADSSMRRFFTGFRMRMAGHRSKKAPKGGPSVGGSSMDSQSQAGGDAAPPGEFDLPPVDLFEGLCEFLDSQIWALYSSTPPDVFAIALRMIFKAVLDQLEDFLLVRPLAPTGLKVLEETLDILIDWYHGEGQGLPEDLLYRLSARLTWLIDTSQLPTAVLVRLFARVKQEGLRGVQAGLLWGAAAEAGLGPLDMLSPGLPPVFGRGKNAAGGVNGMGRRRPDDRAPANRRGSRGVAVSGTGDQEEPLVRAGPDGSLIPFRKDGKGSASQRRSVAAIPRPEDAFLRIADPSAAPIPRINLPPAPNPAADNPFGDPDLMLAAANPFAFDPSANPFEDPPAAADDNPFGDPGKLTESPVRPPVPRGRSGQKREAEPSASAAAANPFLDPSLDASPSKTPSGSRKSRDAQSDNAAGASRPRPRPPAGRQLSLPDASDDISVTPREPSRYARAYRRTMSVSRTREEVERAAAVMTSVMNEAPIGGAIPSGSDVDTEVEERTAEVKVLGLLRPPTLLFLLRLIAARGDGSAEAASLAKRELPAVSAMAARDLWGLRLDESCLKESLLLSVPCCSVSADGVPTMGIAMLTTHNFGFVALGATSNQIAKFMKSPSVKLKRRHQKRLNEASRTSSAALPPDTISSSKEIWVLPLSDLATLDCWDGDPTASSTSSIPSLLASMDKSKQGWPVESLAAQTGGMPGAPGPEQPAPLRVRRLMGFQGPGRELLYIGMLRLSTLARSATWPLRAHIFKVREKIHAGLAIKIPSDADRQMGVCVGAIFCSKRTNDKVRCKPGQLFVGSHMVMFDSTECSRKAIRYETISEVLLNESVIHGLSLKIRSPDIDRRGKVTLVRFTTRPSVPGKGAPQEPSMEEVEEHTSLCHSAFLLVNGVAKVVKDINSSAA